MVDDCGVMDDAVDLMTKPVISFPGEAELRQGHIAVEHDQSACLKLPFEHVLQAGVVSVGLAQACRRGGGVWGAYKSVKPAFRRQSVEDLQSDEPPEETVRARQK